MSRGIVALAALLAGLAVATGAFGAHGLRARVSTELLAVWETAARYHMYHALALLAVGMLGRELPSPTLRGVALCFVVGIALFSGSLYTMTLTGIRALGAVTPFGGLAFLVGWFWLAWGVWRR